MIIPLTIIRKDNNTNFVKAGGFDGISIVRFFGGYAATPLRRSGESSYRQHL